MSAYVIFDGDNDKWAYAYMKGWHQNKNVNFSFEDSHDLDSMTGAAQNEAYVKSKLRERMKRSTAVVVLLGDATKNLYKYIRWELELALELKLPIIVANLNEKRSQDYDLCPAIIRDKCVVHVPFKLAAVKYALDNFPAEYARMNFESKSGGFRFYNDDHYRTLGV